MALSLTLWGVHYATLTLVLLAAVQVANTKVSAPADSGSTP